MEAPPFLNKIIPADAVVYRDAIHIAIVPMIAHEELWAGWSIMLVRNSTTHVRRVDLNRPDEVARCIGVVDPFLNNGKAGYLGRVVNEDERVYVYLNPGSITSLRHHWTHPALGETPKMSVISEAEGQRIAAAVAEELTHGPQKRLLEEFANNIDISYDELLEGAADYVEYGNYMSDGGKFEGVDVPNGFWEAYQVVTGTTVPKDKQYSFFSCSC